MFTFIKTLWERTITRTLETLEKASNAFLDSNPAIALKFTFKWLGDISIKLEFNK